MKQLLYLIIFLSFFLNSKILPQNTEWIVYNSTNSELPGNWVTSIAIDDSGNKWIGTLPEYNSSTNSFEGGGLVKYDGTNWILNDTSNSELPSNRVTSIAIDDSCNKWIGTEPEYDTTSNSFEGKGLVEYDGTNWVIYDTTNSELASNIILCIAIDEFNNKWIGTQNGLVKYDGINWTVFDTTNSELASNCIMSITIDYSGNKWIRNGWGQLVRLNADDTTWTNYSTLVACIAADKYNNKWFGTHIQGLVKLKSDDTTWVVYDSAKTGFKVPQAHGYEDNGYNCIAIDQSDNKWLGISFRGYGPYYAGLAKFDTDNTTWMHYTTSNSLLPSDNIECIAIDKYGNKWIGTLPEYNSSTKSFEGGGLAVFNQGGVITEVEKHIVEKSIPNDYLLSQNYPNPFNPTTRINYSIPKESTVTIKVFDVLGKEVTTLVNQRHTAGHHQVELNANNLSSGIYFYNLQAEDYVETKKMILIK